MYIDNSRPDDPDYPTAEPPEMAFNPDGTNLIVQVGDYVVNRDGDIVIATTSNAGPWPNDYIRSISEGFFRAKHIGNRDDYLEYANQCRHATSDETGRAKQYKQSGFKTTEKGQLVLLQTSPRPAGSSKLLMNQTDGLIFWLSGGCSGYTESPRESHPPERKSLPWSTKVVQPYSLIPPVCS